MPLLVYAVLRAALLVLVLVALWAVGFRWWLLVLLGVVIAWGLSYVLLTRQRDAAAAWLADRAQARRASGVRFSSAVESDAAAEDAAVDAADGRTGPAEGGSDTRHIARPRPSSTP